MRHRGGDDAGPRPPTVSGNPARFASDVHVVRWGWLTMRVLVVDDTSLYRLALADVLGGEPSINVVETAADVGAVLELLAGRGAETVVLVNMSMPDGLAVLNAIVRAVPATAVIALAVSDLEHEIIACAEAGVAGCLLKGDSYADLVALITSVAQGETRCSPRVAAALLRRLATLSKESRVESVQTRLTAREREVMQLVDEGLSNKQIARGSRSSSAPSRITCITSWRSSRYTVGPTPRHCSARRVQATSTRNPIRMRSPPDDPAPRCVRAENSIHGSDQQSCSSAAQPVMLTDHVPAVRFLTLGDRPDARGSRLDRGGDAGNPTDAPVQLSPGVWTQVPVPRHPNGPVPGVVPFWIPGSIVRAPGPTVP